MKALERIRRYGLRDYVERCLHRPYRDEDYKHYLSKFKLGKDRERKERSWLEELPIERPGRYFQAVLTFLNIYGEKREVVSSAQKTREAALEDVREKSRKSPWKFKKKLRVRYRIIRRSIDKIGKPLITPEPQPEVVDFLYQYGLPRPGEPGYDKPLYQPKEKPKKKGTKKEKQKRKPRKPDKRAIRLRGMMKQAGYSTSEIDRAIKAINEG